MEEIALALFLCLILALLSKRYSLPPIPFYILAGIAIGKSGLSLVPSDAYSQYLSSLGLIFLLFYVGLEMRPKSLRERGRSLLLSGGIDLSVNLAVGLAAAFLLGFPPLESFILASAFYISSSAMAIASLVENRRLILPEAETIVWMMVFEDVLLILLISVFSAQSENPVMFILLTVAVLAATVLVVRALRRPIHALLARTDDLPSLFTFTAVISSTYLAKLLKIPDALVAIILGSSLAATSASALDRLSQPFREVFLVLFFVFFGITIDFSGGFSPLVASVLCLLALGSKMASGILVGWRLHGSVPAGIEIGANTLGRGEFSIALAAVFGSAAISATVAILVVATSLVGSFAARYSEGMKVWPGRAEGNPHSAPGGQPE
ncbi:MAG TPA: cation:proton antiporter [Methanomicrobiales archaeon]|nr:cation:proton antiporter [Methanomicrobiales archaeon]